MKTIHETNADNAINSINAIVDFIRSNDTSYEKNLVQVDRLYEITYNLVRYADAIEARKSC